MEHKDDLSEQPSYRAEINEEEVKFNDLSTLFNRKYYDLIDGTISDDLLNSLFKKVSEFAEEMRQKYPNEFDRARLYHLIAGSTVRGTEKLSFDLPGGEIEDFIRNKL